MSKKITKPRQAMSARQVDRLDAALGKGAQVLRALAHEMDRLRAGVKRSERR